MGKKDHHQTQDINHHHHHHHIDRVEAVRQLLTKQAPLTVKQEKFCNNGCMERFLKSKGDSVKKATKQLRACLSWRESIGTDHLIADEFSTEISDGAAYLSGYDDESRPVLVFRIKQDYQKFHSQKLYIRLLVFTLEVAIASMPRNTEQFVLLFDASFFRSASSFMNLLMASLKTISEYYPGRLHKAFVIDPPSLFSYVWKGVRPFVELSAVTMVVSSLDYEESLEYEEFTSFPRASSLRFDPSSIPLTSKIGPSSSSRFSFTVSHNYDTLKPWYLSLTDTSASKVGPNIPSSNMGSSAHISPLNARSYSFASPIARTPRGSLSGASKRHPKFFPLTPLPQKTSNMTEGTNIKHPRTPKPSFLHSPALFFRRDSQTTTTNTTPTTTKTERTREAFLPFLRFYRMPYDEMYYRSKMRPPLGGLISIVTPNIKRRSQQHHHQHHHQHHNLSASQRF